MKRDRRAGADGGGVGAAAELLEPLLVLVQWVEGGVDCDVGRDTGEDEDESVGDKCCR